MRPTLRSIAVLGAAVMASAALPMSSAHAEAVEIPLPGTNIVYFAKYDDGNNQLCVWYAPAGSPTPKVIRARAAIVHKGRELPSTVTTLVSGRSICTGGLRWLDAKGAATLVFKGNTAGADSRRIRDL